MVFEEVILSKRKATQMPLRSPNYLWIFRLDLILQFPTSHTQLSLLNLSRKLIYNCRIGDVELTVYRFFEDRFGRLFSVPILPLVPGPNRYIELGRLT